MSASASKGRILPALLREAYPEHTAKRAAAAAGVSHETARNWSRGLSEPPLSVLLTMAVRCEKFAAQLESILNDRRAAALDNRVSSATGASASSDRGVA